MVSKLHTVLVIAIGKVTLVVIPFCFTGDFESPRPLRWPDSPATRSDAERCLGIVVKRKGSAVSKGIDLFGSFTESI